MADPIMVTINGAAVDAADPCALYAALYAVKAKRLAGEQVTEGNIRSPVSQRQFSYASVSMADLDRELADLRARCEEKTNGRRKRFAIRAGWRRC